MIPAGWNYSPSKQLVVNKCQLPTTDLTVPPPHYSIISLAKRARMQSSVSNLTEVVKSIDARDSQLYAIEERKKSNCQLNRPQSIDVPSLISMEILEAHGRALDLKQNDVLENVTEMKRILNDSDK